MILRCLCCLLLLLAGLMSLQAQTPVPCPDKAHPLYTVDAPARWTVTPAPTADDYVSIEGPSGAVLYLRALPGSLEDAVQEGRDSLKETYADLKFGTPATSTLGGLPATLLDGSGVSREDKSKVSFGMAWIKLPNGYIAEIWYEIASDDASGILRATAIRDSFKFNKDAPLPPAPKDGK